MAAIIKRSEDVVRACTSRLERIKHFRNERLAYAIKQRMKETRFSFRKLKRVPAYASEEEALEAIKTDNRDFFWFGSEYNWIMNYYSDEEKKVTVLRSMAQQTGVIRLSTEDFELIRGYL